MKKQTDYAWIKYINSSNKSSEFIWKNIFKILTFYKKNRIFSIAIILIVIDIILTNIFVIYFNATEINFLCVNFTSFMIIKIIISTTLLYIAYKIKMTPYWINFILILILIYSILLFFNLNNIINYFF